MFLNFHADTAISSSSWINIIVYPPRMTGPLYTKNGILGTSPIPNAKLASEGKLP
jgi:hypothetical protein